MNHRLNVVVVFSVLALASACSVMDRTRKVSRVDPAAPALYVDAQGRVVGPLESVAPVSAERHPLAPSGSACAGVNTPPPPFKAEAAVPPSRVDAQRKVVGPMQDVAPSSAVLLRIDGDVFLVALSAYSDGTSTDPALATWLPAGLYFEQAYCVGEAYVSFDAVRHEAGMNAVGAVVHDTASGPDVLYLGAPNASRRITVGSYKYGGDCGIPCPGFSLNAYAVSATKYDLNALYKVPLRVH